MTNEAPDGFGWRTSILAHFTPEIAAAARVTVVLDPDVLLGERTLLDEVGRAGFALLPFEDPVTFRFTYEEVFRKNWDAGLTTPALVVTARAADPARLPFDVLHAARRTSRVLSFSVASLFPSFEPGLLGEMERADFDTLARAQTLHQPGSMGANATADFLLRHVFDMAPELVRSSADLLRMLLQLHYRGRHLPPALGRRLLALLRADSSFAEWPLEDIVPSRAAFYRFLEERWPAFLRRHAAASDRTAPDAVFERAAPSFPGPADLPFDHPDIRVYLDTLFLEGHLRRADGFDAAAFSGTWIGLGVAGRATERPGLQFDQLSDAVEKRLAATLERHSDWVELARLWGEWLVARHAAHLDGSSDRVARADRLHDQVEARFLEWLQRDYGALHNLPYWPRPVMVHHIPRFLGASEGDAGTKQALVVVDGMAVDQWAIVRDCSFRQGVTPWEIEESAVFAWIPTLTTISRQAIFAGEPPLFFAPSLWTTGREDQHWRRFWEDHGVERKAIAYVKQGLLESTDTLMARVQEQVEDPRCAKLAIIVSVVDQALHGNPVGTGGLHAQVRHWAQEGGITAMCESLAGAGFSIYLTADHGNIQGYGIGATGVGLIATERGERVHVFTDDVTRRGVAERFPRSVVWPPIGLPEECRPLLPAGRGAFIPEGSVTVTHGGASLEEVVVPFVRLTRRR
jgi:hypothetical protein